jgi:predicted nucleotidyltransferase
LLLFGSRAARTAQPTSDYDLLIIFPTSILDRYYSESVGNVASLDKQHGIAVDAQRINEGEWGNLLNHIGRFTQLHDVENRPEWAIYVNCYTFGWTCIMFLKISHESGASSLYSL